MLYKFFLSFMVLIFPALQAAPSIDKVMRRIDTEEIQYVELVFSDLNGNLKQILISKQSIPNALEDGMYFDGSSVPGFTKIFESDMLLIPDLSTFSILPWTNGSDKTARFICRTYKDHDTPYIGDPRNLLEQVVQEAHDMGFNFYVGTEIEFFLLDINKVLDDESNYCQAETNIEMEINKKEIMSALTLQNIEVEKWHHEVAPNQHEITIRYDNPIRIADAVQLAKHTIKQFTKKKNLHASFMPKLACDENGSGMHIHFSLFDKEKGCNAFYDAEDPNCLSTIAKQFMAGVLTYVKELDPLFNSSINSFKRLVPGYEAPIYICWAAKNRSALIRIPDFKRELQTAARAELRCPDCSCNPYLAFAAILKAGLEGIKNELVIPDAIEKNLYKLNKKELRKEKIDTLPSSFQEALLAFKKSEFAYNFLGDILFKEFLKLKWAEVKDFNKTITDWELANYL